MAVASTGLLTKAIRSRAAGVPAWAPYLVPCWFVANVLLKSLLALQLMATELAPGAGAWVWSGVFLACGATATFFLPQRLGDLICWSMAALASLLLWGDVLYYRQFQDFLMLNHFVFLWEPHHQGPVQAAGLQLRHLIQASDYAFWLDLPILLPLLWLLPKTEPKKRRGLRTVPAVMISLFLAGNAVWFLQADRRSTEFYKNRLYNRSHVGRNGLIGYHLYDVYHWIRPRIASSEVLSDEVILRRLEVSARSIGPEYPGFACAEGSNVIVVQLESFQYFVIGMEVQGREVTPFLNSLREECLYGNALDQTASGSTSDAMFVMLNSLQPPVGGPFCFLYPTNSTRAIPRILAERGWSTLHVMSYDGAFWNTRLMAEGFGFEQQIFSTDLRPPGRGESVGWGLSDAALFERVVELLSERSQPFFCYVTTTMMHYPFLEMRSYQKTLELPPELENTMAGYYLQLAKFRDQAVELFVYRLKEKGLWDNTIVVFCGDHRSRMPDSEFQRLGLPALDPVLNRLPLFIHVPKELVRGELADVPGQLDVAPTLLHLLGIQDAGQVFLGRNVLAGAHPSASPYGYISDGKLGLWRGAEESEDRLLRLSHGEPFPLQDPVHALLRKQLDEEVGVSESLLVENRILEFSQSVSGDLKGRVDGGVAAKLPRQFSGLGAR